MADDLLITTEAAVRTLTLNRPESRNGLTLELNRRLVEAFEEAAADRALRCLILTGASGHFCSGVDLKSGGGPDLFEKVEERMRSHFHSIIRALRALPFPSIAQIDGACVGFGCDLALACDLRVAADRAKIGEIFVRRGLMPDGGGTFHLPRLVGLARALELMYTGETVDGTEAARIGLVNHAIPAAELEAETGRLAARIAAGAPIALRNIKRCVYAALDGDLEQALEGEVTGQAQCIRSRDFLEGVSAFFQKREPRFSGE